MAEKKTSAAQAKEQSKAAAETAQTAAENVGITPPSAADVQKARAEGVTEAIKENAKDSFRYMTDGQQPGEPSKGDRWAGSDDIMQFEPNLRLGIDDFTAAIDESRDNPIPEEKVYGLLKLERNGQNRTDYVRAMMKRLGITKDDLPPGGQPFTNDTTPVSAL